MSDDHDTDDPPDDPAAPPPPDTPAALRGGRAKLLWLRAQRESHRPVNRQPAIEVVDDNAARDDEYDPFD
jgi:hypothetical protein